MDVRKWFSRQKESVATRKGVGNKGACLEAVEEVARGKHTTRKKGIYLALICVTCWAAVAATPGAARAFYEVQITTDPAFQGTPAISADRIVWMDARNGNYDIYLYDLSTSTETQITTNAAYQASPAISGNRIVWMDYRNGNYDIYLYDLATSTETQITTHAAFQGYSAISGDRIVWHDYRNANNDIYLVTLGPDSDISPLTYDFGEVEIGFTSSTIVTVTSVGNQKLVVDRLVWPAFSLGCNLGPMDSTGRMSGTFGVLPGATLPTTLEPGQTLDINVTFAPELKTTCSNHFGVLSNDPHTSYSVEVSGTGVSGELPPSEQVEEILTTIDTSLANGTLSGSGEGGSAGGRLGAFLNMIEATGDLVENGQIAEACQQLSNAYKRTDGEEKPPDFVAGKDATALATQIQAMMTSLGCP